MSPSSNEKLWAALSHILALCGWSVGFGQILAPLIIFLAKKDGSAYVAAHARESLNFQLSLIIYALVLVAALFTIILALPAVVALWALGIFDVVMVIVATIKAASGEPFRYPLSLRLVK